MMMFRKLFLASLLGLSAGAVCAQAGSGAGPAAGPAASAPGMGMGMGPGMGPGRGMGHGAGHGARWGSDVTPGWAMMTPQERKEHQDRMRSMQTHEDCKSYQEQHHAQMEERAKAHGGKALAQPRHDACSALKK